MLALAALLWLTARAPAQDCAACHQEQSKKIAGSAHAGVACNGCHQGFEPYPHPSGAARPACSSCHSSAVADYNLGAHGQAARRGNTAAPDCAVCHGDVHDTRLANSAAFRRSVPETCGMCHSEVGQQYGQSVHGKAIARGELDAASCTDCHGEHTIVAPRAPESPVHARNLRETCGECHQDVRLARRFRLPLDRITSFDQSFHGLAAKAGSQTVANCASCHGVHDILPSSDPKATTHPGRLPETCGSCHPGAGSRFAIGRVHWVEGATDPAPVRVVRLAYLIVIPVTLAFMFLHHGGDFVRKLRAMRLRNIVFARPAAGGHVRMYPFERLQHALLLVSFFVLVWTGFALKYPDSWWSWPLVRWEPVYPVRGVVHRVAAVVMCVAAAIHVGSLIASRRLRQHWLELRPTARDFVDAASMLAYNLGLRRKRPPVSGHSYVEKLEYWAVVWGTAVMGITGFLLWLNRYTLQWVPKVWLDVATMVHFYEAVLATASIVVWHFYVVIFDPEVYPMDPAWITGISVRERE